MNTTKTNPSVESYISESVKSKNSDVKKNDDRFYIGLTSLALVGLVTLLIFALA